MGLQFRPYRVPQKGCPTVHSHSRMRTGGGGQSMAGGQLSPTAPPPSEAGTFRVGKGRGRLI